MRPASSVVGAKTERMAPSVRTSAGSISGATGTTCIGLAWTISSSRRQLAWLPSKMVFSTLTEAGRGMMTEISRNERELALVALARRVLPGGSFGNLSSDIVIAEGRAGRVWDVSGNEYIDYLLGSGPMFI